MSTFRGTLRRNSTTIALVIIICVAGAILYIQALATAQLQRQVAQQQQLIGQVKGITEQINASAKDRTQQIDQLNRHLDCVTLFFSQKDRSTKAISNIETCTLKNTTTGQVAPKATSSGATSTPTQTSPQPTTTPEKNPTPEQGVVKNPTPVTQPSVFDRVNDLINKAVGVQ